MSLFTNFYILIPMTILSLVLWLIKLNYRTRVIIISLFSIVVIGILHPVFLVLLAIIVLLLYYLIKCVGRQKLKLTAFVYIGLSIVLIFLLVGKYGEELIDRLFGADALNGFSILVPIGISYFSMKAIQLIIDYRRGLIEQLDLVDMIAFLVFLPTFAAGPVESYLSFKDAYIEDYKREDYVYGMMRILLGYFKKLVITDVILSHYISGYVDSSVKTGVAYLDALMPFLLVIFTFVKAFFDLSAYSDIAIGFSRLFGFKIVENFNRPFWKKNVSEFWRSWHISLSRWCTNNIYFPFFGLTRKVWLGLYASMIVMAMWHDASSIRWYMWGLHHGTGLVLFTLFSNYKRKHKKLKHFFNTKPITFFSHLATFWYVAIGYAFVGAPNFYMGIDRYVSAILALPLTCYELVKLLFV